MQKISSTALIGQISTLTRVLMLFYGTTEATDVVQDHLVQPKIDKMSKSYMNMQKK